jgi:sulfonate transport system substrate-binding protein
LPRSPRSAAARKVHTKPEVVKLDFAYYNPVSLVLKEKKFLEEELAKDNIKVEWIPEPWQQQGTGTAQQQEYRFRLHSRSRGPDRQGERQPDQIGLRLFQTRMDRPGGAQATVLSTKIEDLKGKKVAVTRGTDPHVFLLRALDKVGLSEKDIELVPLQHPDGKNALEKGDVDAWAGLDPHMAKTEVDSGSRLFFRDPDLNTYGILNVREEFAQKYPSYVEKVIAAYEKARLWAIQNPAEFKAILIRDAKLNDAVATRVLERTDLSDPVIGEKQKTTIAAAGDVLKKSGVIKNDTDVPALVNDLIDPQYVQRVIRK